VLFVGTKKQAQIPIAEEAIRSGQPFVAERYIGGMLTNFQTILPRIQYFKELAVRVEETPEEERTGKDWFALNREYQKLRRNFAGITEMERLPGAVFVVDPKREELLVKEANRLKIPVLALTDTNCDPEVIDYVIPGNDDAIRSISLISRLVADAVIAGRGEETHLEERPVPPVIEDSQVGAEVQQTGTTEAPNGVSSAPPADEPEVTAGPEPVPEADNAEEPELAAEATTEDVEPEAADTEVVDADVSEGDAVEAEAVDPEVAEPEATAEPEAEEPVTEETEEPERVEEEAPGEESEETEEK
ncbi:MAG: 30S ribosomal protein S2, partial [Actinomycetota bacterium]|nr:30S ribosomal protein S2 [Actinomycetota bacterium]